MKGFGVNGILNHICDFDMEGKVTRKLLYLSLNLFFKMLLFHVDFLIFGAIVLVILSSGWFRIGVCSSISVREIVK